MKTNIGLLVGGLVLLLGSAASASTISETCGNASTANGSVTFDGGGTYLPGSGGSVAASSGSAVFTCNAFSLNPSWTLQSVTIAITDSANSAANNTSQLTYSWSYSGSEVLTPTPAIWLATLYRWMTRPVRTTQFLAFPTACTGGTPGNLVCNGSQTFGYTGGTTGNYILSLGLRRRPVAIPA